MMRTIIIFIVHQVLHRVSIGKRMRWVGHVACTRKGDEYRVLVRKPKTDHSEDVETHEMIILKWTLKKWDI